MSGRHELQRRGFERFCADMDTPSPRLASAIHSKTAVFMRNRRHLSGQTRTQYAPSNVESSGTQN